MADDAANDQVEGGADFFNTWFVDQFNLAEYSKIEGEGNSKAALKVDPDDATVNGGTWLGRFVNPWQ